MRHRIVLLILFSLQLLAVAAEDSANERQAKRIFNQAFNQVFGEQGATLHYDVNIASIYHTQGSIWYKGRKARFSDERADVWNDGSTVYMAYRKKRTVEIHDPQSDKKDKHSGKFKFGLDDFNENYAFSVADGKEGLLLTLKQKKSAKGSIKEVKALVKRRSYEPIKLRIKVAFVWTTVKISNFRSGGIDDSFFVFPQEKYKGWKFVDKRKE